MGKCRSEECGDKQEAAEGDGDGVRGAEQGFEEGEGDGEEGGDMAVRAVQPGGAAVRAAGLRQEGAAGFCQESREPGRAVVERRRGC